MEQQLFYNLLVFWERVFNLSNAEYGNMEWSLAYEVLGVQVCAHRDKQLNVHEFLFHDRKMQRSCLEIVSLVHAKVVCVIQFQY